MPAIAARLQGALARLLAEPEGDSYRPDEFLNRVWRYLRALGQTRNGQQFLDEHGSLVWHRTKNGSEYAQTWRRGIRQVLKLRIAGMLILPWGPLAHSRHKQWQKVQDGSLNPLIGLWQTPRQKSWAVELEDERRRIEMVLSELERECVSIRKVVVKYNLLEELRRGNEQESSQDRAKRDLQAWWSATMDIVCDAQDCHADGCRFLLGMQRRKLDAGATAVVKYGKFGRHYAEEIKAAATFLVDQLGRGKGRKGKTSFDAARRSKADNDKLLLTTALLKYHKLDDVLAGHKDAKQAIHWTPASSKDLEQLTRFSQSKVSRLMKAIFGARPINAYRRRCREQTLQGFIRRHVDDPTSCDVDAPSYRPLHPTDDEERRAVND